MKQTDKFDVVWQIESRLSVKTSDRDLLEKFQWLLKVWNTHDDRPFELFDPSKPHGANYVPDDEDD